MDCFPTSSSSQSSSFSSSRLTIDDNSDHRTSLGYLSDGLIVRPQERKKGVPWTEEEHRTFLIGLEKLGKGDWRGISRNYVTTRTPTQVASHAQKYFIRLASMNKKKRRSSLFDMVGSGSRNTRVDYPINSNSSDEQNLKSKCESEKKDVNLSLLTSLQEETKLSKNEKKSVEEEEEEHEMWLHSHTNNYLVAPDLELTLGPISVT